MSSPSNFVLYIPDIVFIMSLSSSFMSPKYSFIISSTSSYSTYNPSSDFNFFVVSSSFFLFFFLPSLSCLLPSFLSFLSLFSLLTSFLSLSSLSPSSFSSSLLSSLFSSSLSSSSTSTHSLLSPVPYFISNSFPFSSTVSATSFPASVNPSPTSLAFLSGSSNVSSNHSIGI